MKIYTKITFEWKDGEYVKTDEDSYEHDGPVAECKGGGGGQENYENLNRLYGIQADQAELLGSYAKDTVLPAYRGFLTEARGYGSQANQEFEAGQVGAASDAATSSAEQNLASQMASLGVNPGSAEYWKQQRGIQIAGAGQKAGAMTAARKGIRDTGFARTQDAVSLGMGTPTQATAAANSAASAATAAMQGQNQQDSNRTNGISSAVRGGFNLYNAWNDKGGGFADGGQVLRLKGGGFVRRMAQGGVLGSRGIVPPPPPMGKPLTSPVQEAIGGAARMAASAGGGSVAGGLGKGISAVGEKIGSAGMQEFGGGMQNAPGLKDMATSLVDQAMGNTTAQASTAGMDALGATVAEEAATVAAEQAIAGTAAETAATVGAETAISSGLGTLGTTVGAAIPVLGAGLALYGIGNAAGWWADGGEVEPGSVGDTGPISGPGGPKDDLIPAMLSDGEFVMPVGAVQLFGLDKLEKMRQKGLEFEGKLGISRSGNGQNRTGQEAQR